MKWSDRFKFGMFSGYTVAEVFNAKPSYLVWIVINTEHRFEPTVMDDLHKLVSRGPGRSLSIRMIWEFNNKFKPGPW